MANKQMNDWMDHWLKNTQPAKSIQNHPKPSQNYPQAAKPNPNQSKSPKTIQTHPQVPEISNQNFLQLIF